jgi:hypothetical protein
MCAGGSVDRWRLVPAAHGVAVRQPAVRRILNGTSPTWAQTRRLPEKINTAHGAVLLRDAGVITFADTFDLVTGEFISSETIVNKGPHPEADSDFTLFCEMVTGALA